MKEDIMHVRKTYAYIAFFMLTSLCKNDISDQLCLHICL